MLIILSSFFGQSNSVWGQPAIQLDSVQVGLFPDYQGPVMLVVLNIERSGDTGEPVMLTFRVPAGSESLSVIRRTIDGERLPLPYEIVDDGEWKEVRFTTGSQTIQIEYIDPNLVKEEDRRFYRYRWLSIYPVDALTLTVRQPFGAGEIHAEPPLDEVETGPDQATYFTQDFENLLANELFTLDLVYTKDTANLAYPALDVEPAQPVTDATPGRSPSPLSVIMWLLTVAIAVLVLVGLYYWWFKSNVMEKQDRMVQGVGIMNPEKQVVFCHECGMRSRPGDTYCSNCGTELRRPTQNIRQSNA